MANLALRLTSERRSLLQKARQKLHPRLTDTQVVDIALERLADTAKDTSEDWTTYRTALAKDL